MDCISIVGGGLAGSEAAWQLAVRGIPVQLFEMKPVSFSPAHKSPLLGELVCSNSLRSDDIHSAVGLLKEEMRLAGSLILQAAEATRVPAGKALAVDRKLFAQYITDRIESHPLISIRREEITTVPTLEWTILATGPLTSEPLAQDLKRLLGEEYLYFYDAIAPIVSADSLDYTIVFRQSRYDSTLNSAGDYLNCPMDREQYETFVNALLGAEKTPLKSFEKSVYFEGCLPIEVMAERGQETLRFGPMKPVGLTDPRTGRSPYAVVQLRQENLAGDMYNMVGFQTKLKWPEQARVFRMIPGMEHAEFLRFGSIHRNTFICAPKVLSPALQIKTHPHIFLAGQLSGVEGYVESTAAGWMAGVFAACLLQGVVPPCPSQETAHGALLHHLLHSRPEHFQPMNINFGLFAPLSGRYAKAKRGEAYSDRALAAWRTFLSQVDEAAPVGK
jgi:methylenetetrahydrofolate--tRNA-(uracil-5-)-methyltransferase